MFLAVETLLKTAIGFYLGWFGHSVSDWIVEKLEIEGVNATIFEVCFLCFVLTICYCIGMYLDFGEMV